MTNGGNGLTLNLIIVSVCAICCYVVQSATSIYTKKTRKLVEFRRTGSPGSSEGYVTGLETVRKEFLSRISEARLFNVSTHANIPRIHHYKVNAIKDFRTVVTCIWTQGLCYIRTP